MSTATVAKYMRRFLLVAVILFLAALWFMPLCWIFSTSLRLPKNSFTLPPMFFPTEFFIENYLQVFQKLPFAKFFVNSACVTVTGTFFQVIVSALAAYAFSRIEFVGKNFWFVIILSGIMIPVQSTIVPKFLILRDINLLNTLQSLILPAIIDPLAIFLLRQFMLTIPRSYDESAYIDGAGRWQIFWRVILPMSGPSVAVVVTTRSLVLWNDFFQPLIFISGYDFTTLPLGLNILKGQMGTGSVSVVMAGVVLSFIPPLLLYIFCQKQLMSGSVLSGLKS